MEVWLQRVGPSKKATKKAWRRPEEPPNLVDPIVNDKGIKVDSDEA